MIRNALNHAVRAGCCRSHRKTKELRSSCIKRKFSEHILGSDRGFLKMCFLILQMMSVCVPHSVLLSLHVSLSLCLSSRCQRQTMEQRIDEMERELDCLFLQICVQKLGSVLSPFRTSGLERFWMAVDPLSLSSCA